MKIGGWKTRSMINRYAHPSIDHKRKALGKLSNVPLIFPTGEKSDALIKIDNYANQH